MRNSYIAVFIKLFLFLIIFCFVVGLTQQFFWEAQARWGLSVSSLLGSIFFAFFFYAFIVDLNEFYKKAQMFFFHSSLVSYLVPFLLVVAGALYFFLPRLFNLHVNQALFIFLGGFIFTAQMIYIASQTRGTSFAEFINYLFSLSLFYIVNLTLLGLYLKVASNFHIGGVLIEGLRVGLSILRGFLL